MGDGGLLKIKCKCPYTLGFSLHPTPSPLVTADAARMEVLFFPQAFLQIHIYHLRGMVAPLPWAHSLPTQSRGLFLLSLLHSALVASSATRRFCICFR